MSLYTCRMDNILQKIRAAIFPKNLYVKKVCNLPEVTDHIIQKATTPMSETKKGKNAGESMHFTVSATVKVKPSSSFVGII